MRVMAVDAMIARSVAGGEIPVPGHPAVSTVVVIAGLRSMALTAQQHGVVEADRASIGET